MPFPRFEDGDVEIKFTEKSESYVLHSYVLALHSPWFKASLSEKWIPEQATTSHTRRVYELRFDKDTAIGVLMRSSSVGDTQMLQLEPTSQTDPKSMEKLQAQRTAVVDAYQAMLGALYHVPPTFGQGWKSTSAVIVQEFVSTTDYYGCGPLIQIHVNDFLNQNRRAILRDCERDPYSMVTFGAVVQKGWITREASVYIICRDTSMRNPTTDEIAGHHADLFAV